MVKKTAFTNGKHDLKKGIDFIGVSCGSIIHDGKGRILLQKRSINCRDEQGAWDNTGGAHEFGEDIEQTVVREIQEELGTAPLNLRFLAVYDAHRKLADDTPTHWVSVLFAAEVDPSKVRNNEPYKIDEIKWFSPKDLPRPLHSLVPRSLKAAQAAGIFSVV